MPFICFSIERIFELRRRPTKTSVVSCSSRQLLVAGQTGLTKHRNLGTREIKAPANHCPCDFPAVIRVGSERRMEYEAPRLCIAIHTHIKRFPHRSLVNYGAGPGRNPERNHQRPDRFRKETERYVASGSFGVQHRVKVFERNSVPFAKVLLLQCENLFACA